MSENNSMGEIGRVLQEMQQREKRTKLERFRRLNRFVKEGQILFVGSSLMEQFPIDELLMDRGLDYIVYNRGVGGFTTQELFAALDECVYALRPAHIFINIGTNDMNGPDYTLDGLLRRYEGILRDIREHLPQAKLYMLAYYPLCEPVLSQNSMMKEILAYRNNQVIQTANVAIQKLADQHGIPFLDCNASITDGTGNMKREYTVEGMHIYANGYDKILDLLLPTLKEIMEG